MAICVELVCDGGSGRCRKLPVQRAVNATTVGVVLAQMHRVASESGWVRRRGIGWLCPACARGVVPLARVA
jgi:hypothetical protein